MAKDLNKVQLTGRLGADPEMRFTPQGSTVTTFRVASNRSWRSTDGQTHEDTEWFSVVAWNKLAEICNQYLSKGTRVYVEGRLQTRSWDDAQSGEKRYKTEVVANDLIILDGRRDNGSMMQSSDEDEVYDEPPAPPVSRAPERPQPAPAAPARGAANGNGGTRGAAAPSRPARSAQPASGGRNKVVLEEEDLPF